MAKCCCSIHSKASPNSWNCSRAAASLPECQNKRNVFRAAVSPVAGSKRAIELKGLHAKIHGPHCVARDLHQPRSGSGPKQLGAAAPELDWDRFRVVHLLTKQDKRIIGDVKVTASGKVEPGAESRAHHG